MPKQPKQQQKIRCDLTSRPLTPPVNQFFTPFWAGNKCFYHTRLLQFTTAAAVAVDVRFFRSSHLCFLSFLVWNTTRWAHAHSLTHSLEPFNSMLNTIGNFYAATVCVHVCKFGCVCSVYRQSKRASALMHNLVHCRAKNQRKKERNMEKNVKSSWNEKRTRRRDWMSERIDALVEFKFNSATATTSKPSTSLPVENPDAKISTWARVFSQISDPAKWYLM